MRVLAEETGGLAVVNMNNFDKALEADRQRQQRLLRARLLLDQPGSDAPPPQDRGEGGAERHVASSRARNTCSSRRGLPRRRAEAHSRFLHPRLTAGRQATGRHRRLPSVRPLRRDTVSSMSAPTKFTPSRAQATAVLPSPVNGSITRSMRDVPCRRRHCSGSRDGNVAGCGRSRSRR